MTELTKKDIAALVKLQNIDLETEKLKTFLRDGPVQIKNLDKRLDEFTARLKMMRNLLLNLIRNIGPMNLIYN